MKFGIMKFGVLFCALLVTAVSGAQASEERMITVSDVHNFTNRAEAVINTGSPGETRDNLALMIATNAQFSENVFRPQYYAGWSNIGYGYVGYNGYYARPYGTYGYVPANYLNLSKGSKIDRIIAKKHGIADYQVRLDVTNIEINPYGNTAVVSLDMRESGRVYNAYYPGFAQEPVFSSSRCRMYLMKGLDAAPVMTRMDCNTNTTLPL